MTYGNRLYYEHSGEGEIFLYFDYDPTVVEAVKHAVPLGHRRWSPERRRWVVSEEFWPRLRKTLSQYGLFDEADFEELDRRGRSAKPGSDWAALYLAPGAPAEVVKAAYLALAKLYHPDWGDGTAADRDKRTSKMAQINVAYERLTEGAHSAGAGRR